MSIAVHRNCRGLGDIVMMEPLFRMLCDLHGTESIDLFTRRPMDLVHARHPLVGVSEVQRDVERTRRSLEELRLLYPEYDHVYDLSTHAFQYEVASQPEVEKNRTELWAEHCGVDIPSASPSIYLSSEERRQSIKAFRDDQRIIGIGYESADFWRSYPYMDDLIRLLSKSFTVWVFHDKPMPSLLRLAQSNHRVELMNGIGIRELLWRIRACRAVVSPDTAAIHIAGALRVPVYGIFGPTDPDIRLKDYSIPWAAPVRYEPCGRSYCWYAVCSHRVCLRSLHPRRVIKGLESVLVADLAGKEGRIYA